MQVKFEDSKQQHQQHKEEQQKQRQHQSVGSAGSAGSSVKTEPSSKASPPKTRKVHILNLPRDCKKKDVMETFEEIGPLRWCEMNQKYNFASLVSWFSGQMIL